MDGGWRRPKWGDCKRSQKKTSPRFCWQPTVPSWEKEFCKVVGSLDWDTLLQMKKFVHLYDNVINWNDSAGEEAFFNAKKRFWARKNGLPCDIPLPDPDSCIDRIDWDINIDPGPLPDLDAVPNEEENHEHPVILFGDAFIANQAFSPSGWGDDEDNYNFPANYSFGDHDDPLEQNRGNPYSYEPAFRCPGFTLDGQSLRSGSDSRHMQCGSGWHNG
ncbi:hypothetical protein F511_25810 [Dorcoceras hygrometricum]|uniref:Uncharacterized protein n=1 Tax=Dorcoceras hygrometricum TaxID=472368 RepID=A0A2Z7BUR0_9LAMI|nr:hypothetical protein F511_25810 [Dorcoceras hygrometricum]